MAQRATVHSLLQYRNWVHEMYTVFGSGEVSTCDKAEELFAIGLVNAKRLYGFQDFREKIKEKSIGILLNTVTKH